ncbi:hypothetical protein [Nocardioides marmotae]|uniref:hypothetical protein n=1 Tax=Nocardioides marmotae TaxID=2663857 RepID=UPI0012B57321|nr:hypothetical protein [Nocardioides marmotae]MBC9735492.1 hypothetical protein [Nocardioides marmotae]MTB86589.1 hypothetical protein [Nocardioides marmotae]
MSGGHPARGAARAVPVALAALAVLAVVRLRGHALTYLAGGPAIALLTAVVLSSWRTRTSVEAPLRRRAAFPGRTAVTA